MAGSEAGRRPGERSFESSFDTFLRSTETEPRNLRNHDPRPHFSPSPADRTLEVLSKKVNAIFPSASHHRQQVVQCLPSCPLLPLASFSRATSTTYVHYGGGR